MDGWKGERTGVDEVNHFISDGRSTNHGAGAWPQTHSGRVCSYRVTTTSVSLEFYLFQVYCYTRSLNETLFDP